MSAIVLVLKFTSLVNGKTIRTIEQIFVAFSEKLNFIKFIFSKMFYMFFLQVHFQFYIFSSYGRLDYHIAFIRSKKFFFLGQTIEVNGPYNLEIKNLTQYRGSFTNIRSVSKCASLDSAIAVVQCRRRPILPPHNELIYSEKDIVNQRPH